VGAKQISLESLGVNQTGKNMANQNLSEKYDNVYWEGRKVFITGGTGLVGSWLIKDLLFKKAEIVALIRDADPQSELFRSGDINKISVVSGSLENYTTIERAINENEIETIFHLGAQAIVNVAHRNPLHTFEVNIRGTYHVLEAARVHSEMVKSIIIASSDKAYGTHKKLPYTETMRLAGSHPYDVSKSCADSLAQSYYHTYNLPVGITRCGNIFGGGDLNWSRIVPGTIKSLYFNESPVIRSDGTFIRDYIYVKDIVRSYEKLSESLNVKSLHGQSFNFSNQSPKSVVDIVRMIQSLMKKNIQLDIQNCAKNEIQSQYLSSEKARRILQWVPKYSLEEGLKETISWYTGYLSGMN
jgi:CDP-glucose 4,6-dehydratase